MIPIALTAPFLLGLFPGHHLPYIPIGLFASRLAQFSSGASVRRLSRRRNIHTTGTPRHNMLAVFLGITCKCIDTSIVCFHYYLGFPPLQIHLDGHVDSIRLKPEVKYS